MSGFLNEQNEQQTRNMFLAILLALGVMLVWQAFGTPRTPPPTVTAEPVTTDDGSANVPAAPTTLQPTPDSPAVPAAAIVPPQVLVGPNHVVTLTNEGARIAGVTVVAPEQYRPHDTTMGVFPSEDDTTALPLAIAVDGLPDLREDSVYEWLETESAETAGGYSRVAYRWRSPDGQISVVRTFEVDPSRAFVVGTTVSVENHGTLARQFGGVETRLYGRFDRSGGGMFQQAGSITEVLCAGEFGTKRKPAKNIDEIRTFGTGAEVVDFAAIDERYFINAIVADEGTELKTCAFEPRNENHAGAAASTGSFEVPPQGRTEFRFLVYSGPKHGEYLDAIPGDLKRSVDLGWFSFIAVPIRYALLFFQGLVVNWGLAIVLLTVSVKLLLFPVTQSSYVSMEKMKLVQPKLAELQKKFENDKAKLAEEQMALFKREGVNPLGGCLPMLAQMPIYIALYRTIWGSTELYNAPLALWIRDLSQPDPYFVLPVLLGVIMFAQNKLMPPPSGGGEMQLQMAQVQKFMPILFTMMMLFLPSGLVLYILVNMLLSIAQMLHIKRRFAGAGAPGDANTNR